MNSIHRIFKDGVAIERINLIRATINEAQEIKDILLDDIDCNKIIVDLSTCNYIDSSFFGAMVFAYRLLKHEECAFALVLGNSFLSRSFIYEEITSVFKVYHSMNEAMNALNNRYPKVNTENFKSAEAKAQPANIVQLQLMLNPE